MAVPAETFPASEETTEFDTDAYLKLTNGIEPTRIEPLTKIPRLLASGEEAEAAGKFWGAILFYKAALDTLEGSGLPEDEQDSLLNVLTKDIDRLEQVRENLPDGWPLQQNSYY